MSTRHCPEPPPWWTAADQAELEVLVWHLVEGLTEHKVKCPRCRAELETGWPCPLVGEAIDAVLDWRRRRDLLSRAQYLRRLADRGLAVAA
jgi:hypothetical protein